METSKLPKFYFDLRKAVKSYADNDTPWTPAVSLVIGVDAALQQIRAEGIENVWARHKRLANAIRAGVVGAGLETVLRVPVFRRNTGLGAGRCGVEAIQQDPQGEIRHYHRRRSG
jgi:aspartate aminotransferase-like enzyme